MDLRPVDVVLKIGQEVFLAFDTVPAAFLSVYLELMVCPSTPRGKGLKSEATVRKRAYIWLKILVNMFTASCKQRLYLKGYGTYTH